MRKIGFRGETVRTSLRGRHRPALAMLIAVGSLAIMGAQCQPTKPPGTPPGGGGSTPIPPSGGTTPPPATGGVFTASLDGAQAGTLSSLGTGTATVELDASETTITMNLLFSGLTGATTGARIHGPAAPGVTGPVVVMLPMFPIGVTASTYVSPSLAITAAQVSNLKAGQLYIVISSTFATAGEIRGQLTAVS